MKLKNDPIIDFKTLAGIESLELRARLLAQGILSGIHRSPRCGNSPEFREFREFHTGDSPREIDWRATARRDSFQIRIREDETNLRVRLVVDVSRSLNYRGKRAVATKWEYLRTIAAALLWLLQHQGDQVGLTLLGEKTVAQFPCSSRLTHRDRMLAALAHTPNSDAFAVESYLEELTRQCRDRSLVIVLSDLYLEPELLGRAAQNFASRKSRLLVYHILDHSECELEWEEPVLVRDLETDEELLIHPDERRAGFRSAMRNHCAALEKAATGEFANYAFFDTSTPPIEALARALLAEKEARR